MIQNNLIFELSDLALLKIADLLTSRDVAVATFLQAIKDQGTVAEAGRSKIPTMFSTTRKSGRRFPTQAGFHAGQCACIYRPGARSGLETRTERTNRRHAEDDHGPTGLPRTNERTNGAAAAAACWGMLPGKVSNLPKQRGAAAGARQTRYCRV